MFPAFLLNPSPSHCHRRLFPALIIVVVVLLTLACLNVDVICCLYIFSLPFSSSSLHHHCRCCPAIVFVIHPLFKRNFYVVSLCDYFYSSFFLNYFLFFSF
jgi:hypothetical protein